MLSSVDIHRNTIGIQSPRPSIGHIGISQGSGGQTGAALATHESEKVEIKPIPIGDQKVRSKIRFEVVTARVIETGGKKHVVKIVKYFGSSLFTNLSPFIPIC